MYEICAAWHNTFMPEICNFLQHTGLWTRVLLGAMRAKISWGNAGHYVWAVGRVCRCGACQTRRLLGTWMHWIWLWRILAHGLDIIRCLHVHAGSSGDVLEWLESEKQTKCLACVLRVVWRGRVSYVSTLVLVLPHSPLQDIESKILTTIQNTNKTYTSIEHEGSRLT